MEISSIVYPPTFFYKIKYRWIKSDINGILFDYEKEKEYVLYDALSIIDAKLEIIRYIEMIKLGKLEKIVYFHITGYIPCVRRYIPCERQYGLISKFK
jgi:hypothetical protein